MKLTRSTVINALAVIIFFVLMNIFGWWSWAVFAGFIVGQISGNVAGIMNKGDN